MPTSVPTTYTILAWILLEMYNAPSYLYWYFYILFGLIWLGAMIRGMRESEFKIKGFFKSDVQKPDCHDKDIHVNIQNIVGEIIIESTKAAEMYLMLDDEEDEQC